MGEIEEGLGEVVAGGCEVVRLELRWGVLGREGSGQGRVKGHGRDWREGLEVEERAWLGTKGHSQRFLSLTLTPLSLNRLHRESTVRGVDGVGVRVKEVKHYLLIHIRTHTYIHAYLVRMSVESSRAKTPGNGGRGTRTCRLTHHFVGPAGAEGVTAA